jgi:hypothetical protein
MRTVHMLQKWLGQAAAIWLLIAGVGGAAAAQPCIGDCKGVGRVTIDDLVLAVNVVLGVAALDQCAALGPAPVGIDRLIVAVNNALCGCQSCPTPLPTNTFTATPNPTATIATPTPSATPTLAPVVSMWQEDSVKVPSSSCPSAVTDQIRQQLATAMDDLTVSQLGQDVEIEDTEGNVESGTIDADGTVTLEDTETQSSGGCFVTLAEVFTVNLSSSPAAAKYSITVSTAGCPRSLSCKLEVTSRWTRISAALHRGTSVRAAVRATL